MNNLAFLFAGQGSQFLKMGEYFYENYKVARNVYSEASEACNKDVSKLCLESSPLELSRFTNMQIAVVTTEIAIWRSFNEKYGIAPQYVLGHSIGEYAALVCAGAISLSDAIKVLLKRGSVVERIVNQKIGRMAIVERLQQSDIENIIQTLHLNDKVFISCYNSKEQFALSGYNEELNVVEDEIINKQGVITDLPFSPPIHSPIMNAAKAELFNYLSTIQYKKMRIPVITNYTGKSNRIEQNIPYLMSEQLTNPVLWSDSMKVLHDHGVTMTIEMSPKILTSDFNLFPDVKTLCYGIKKHRADLEEIAKVDSVCKEKIYFVGSCLRFIATTINGSQEKLDLNKIMSNYKDLQVLHEKEKTRQLEIVEQKEALKTLIETLSLKKLSFEEINNDIYMLLDETNKLYELKSDIQKPLYIS
ncbi:ACP S-malonyltransferase [Clostridium sp. E02]|uniref:ACP S-malonyltransferase n=1 Tax=Clostridium sp. E02 TaxID=2487134 RepID=UPI000F523179|nr:ACP S-malonyltransferase [Clostridium sp. E02]